VSDTDATDRALWDRALCGDDRAFVTVYDRYAQRLLTYAHPHTGCFQRAEDAVSQVMLEPNLTSVSWTVVEEPGVTLAADDE
jgi:hypothetical protein